MTAGRQERQQPLKQATVRQQRSLGNKRLRSNSPKAARSCEGFAAGNRGLSDGSCRLNSARKRPIGTAYNVELQYGRRYSSQPGWTAGCCADANNVLQARPDQQPQRGRGLPLGMIWQLSTRNPAGGKPGAGRGASSDFNPTQQTSSDCLQQPVSWTADFFLQRSGRKSGRLRPIHVC